jgi:methionyl-tRNA formyltransferase
LTPILEEYECVVIEYSDMVDTEFLQSREVEFAVSFRYRYIIDRSVIEYMSGKVINLHISLLPWNRGADPNLWSFLEDTPKGVTIHCVDEGLDTGDIIVQKEIFFYPTGETLASTYEQLNQEIIGLFKQYWLAIANGEAPRRQQPSGGSFHLTSDKEMFLHLLAEKGWDTPVEELVGRALYNS